jgi:hypothetical protein
MELVYSKSFGIIQPQVYRGSRFDVGLVYRWMHGLPMNINNDIIEPTHMHRKLQYESNIDIWWVCPMRDSLCTMVIIWVDTSLNHIDIGMILPRLEVSYHRI